MRGRRMFIPSIWERLDNKGPWTGVWRRRTAMLKYCLVNWGVQRKLGKPDWKWPNNDWSPPTWSIKALRHELIFFFPSPTYISAGLHLATLLNITRLQNVFQSFKSPNRRIRWIIFSSKHSGKQNVCLILKLGNDNRNFILTATRSSSA